jgi:hypothetical protein
MFTNQIIILNLIMNIGWIAMTTGFSVVLYSRLHLVNPGKKVLQIALIVIIVDAILVHGSIFTSIIYSMVHPTAVAWKVYGDISFSEVVFTVHKLHLPHVMCFSS